jgi:hypothetical protein
MTDLSPAAQAVLDASSDAPVGDGWNADRLAIAAALRAAADQVAPGDYDCAVDDRGWVDGAEDRNAEIREQILAIAAELEAQ